MSALNRSDLLDFVRDTPLFTKLAEQSFESIGRGIRFIEVEQGTTLFHRDQPASIFYVVIEGWVKVFRTTPSGGEAIIGIFTRGQSFAEIAALAEDNYPADGVAVSHAILAEIPIHTIRDAISGDTQVAMVMLSSISRHVRRLVDEIEQMKGRSGTQRVMEFIANLSPAEKGPTRIQLPYEKSIIARKVGMKAESLSRIFRNLRRYGVRIEDDMAVVDDIEKLRRTLAIGDSQLS